MPGRFGPRSLSDVTMTRRAPPPPPSRCPGDGSPGNGSPVTGGSCVLGQEVRDEEEGQSFVSWRHDDEDHGLDRKWLLWQEFMEEHAQLDAWLQLAEQAVGSCDSAHISYARAREMVVEFERLCREANHRLAQADGLANRSRELLRVCGGGLTARLLSASHGSLQRWEEVTAQLRTHTHTLQSLVSEWEGFEAERAELALWLADLDVRLRQLEQRTGSSRGKMHQLEVLQQCVCACAGRVNAALDWGETLMEASVPGDARYLETLLLDLLLLWQHTFTSVEQAHTRLLSMRLVLEDDSLLSQVDSGCPSETDLAPTQNALQLDHSELLFPTTHEHLGLEWDPSVDIGRSVSRGDSDSPYFDSNTGPCYRNAQKRWSYLSSRSDVIDDFSNQEVDQVTEWSGHTHAPSLSPVRAHVGGAHLPGNQACGEEEVFDPMNFDGGRVRAWLGGQRTSCSKEVQTDWLRPIYAEERLAVSRTHADLHDDQQCYSDMPVFSTPPDQNSHSDWQSLSRESDLQTKELSFEDDIPPSGQCRGRCRPLLQLLLALALLTCLAWGLLDPPCHRSNRLPRTFQLALRYVNGPPPT